jgi:hypothetical protein
MKCQATLWFGNSKEELMTARQAEGELLSVETDAFPVKGSDAARAMYAFAPAGSDTMFFRSMRALVSSKIGSGLHYHLSDLAPVGGWPVVDRKQDKYEGLTTEEREIMKKADEITAKCKAMKAARKEAKKIEDMPPETSGDVSAVKTETQKKKERKAAKVARLAAETAEFKGEMSEKTKQLNEIAKQIGPSWTAEKVKVE